MAKLCAMEACLMILYELHDPTLHGLIISPRLQYTYFLIVEYWGDADTDQKFCY